MDSFQEEGEPRAVQSRKQWPCEADSPLEPRVDGSLRARESSIEEGFLTRRLVLPHWPALCGVLPASFQLGIPLSLAIPSEPRGDFPGVERGNRGYRGSGSYRLAQEELE